jgi:signal transduction histidine kinase
LGWIAYLKEKYPQEQASDELMKDAERLSDITERFSKIGSVPELKIASLFEETRHMLSYLEKRIPRNVSISFECPENLKEIRVKLNPTLFQWVIENLTKNAIDAMGGRGKLTLKMGQTGNRVYLDVADTGKGISTGDRKRIFLPGFTTKQRGWGLGLALARRIIEEYHRGKIVLLSSKPGEGSTFRIVMERA